MPPMRSRVTRAARSSHTYLLASSPLLRLGIFLLVAASTPFITHEASLPMLSRRLISDRARLIFAFVLEYVGDAEVGLDADVYASGGYVRDLLLG